MPVNPKHGAIEGVLAYPDVASLPLVPDLAVIGTPPETVPGIIAELAGRGTKAAVVITAGFGEGGEARGAELRQAMLDAGKPHLHAHRWSQLRRDPGARASASTPALRTSSRCPGASPSSPNRARW